MSLPSTQTLAQNIRDVFYSQQDDDDFSEGIADVIKNYIEAGDVITQNTGVRGVIYFDEGGHKVHAVIQNLKGKNLEPTAEGTGKATLTASRMSSILKSTCVRMLNNYATSGYDGNNDLAVNIQSAFKNMVNNINNSVSVVVEGIMVNVGGQHAVDFTCTTKGKITVNDLNPDLKTKLNNCFASMDNMTSGGDMLFANALATAIHDYVTGVTVTASYSEYTPISYVEVTGTGSIS